MWKFGPDWTGTIIQHMTVRQPQECNLSSATYEACTATLPEAHYEQQTKEYTVLLLM